MAGSIDIFDGARTPLQAGTTLVEASAGTGKTFAISMLVLRAVVECGIDIKEILTVTFTDAATRELRGRVRQRLADTRNLLHGHIEAPDDVLREWVKTLPDLKLAQKRIDLALLDVDAAPIHTIHGFCQRVLSEQVLESGHLFDMDLVSDTSTLQAELLQDFWRATMYEIDERHGALIIGTYENARDLVKSVKGADRPLTRLLPATEPFADVCDAVDRARGRLHSWWREQGEMLRADLGDSVSRDYFKVSMSGKYEQWLDAIAYGFTNGSAVDPAAVSGLDARNLVEEIKKNKIKDVDRRWELINGMALPFTIGEDYVQAVEQLLLTVRVELARFLREEFADRLHRAGRLSFNELIIDLARALERPDGARLARAVGARYRVALIDEFQDTDKAQYEIFSRLFGHGEHHLYLIGDPKQAIYRFRGADINSYIKARERVDRLMTLDCNYRSTPDLVDAVNGFFSDSEIAGLPYQPVSFPQAADRKILVDEAGEQPGLIYCQLDENTSGKGTWAKKDAEPLIRTWVVREVLSLIDPENGWNIRSTDGNGGYRYEPLKPCHISILVRTNQQAEDLFDELSRQKIPVVLSSRKPVLETPECTDLLVLLQAVAAPTNASLLATALGCDWFGLDGNHFHRVITDDSLLERYRERFIASHQRWLESGLLAMMNRLLEDERVFLNLSGSPQAERRITNIQHLVELVHQQADEQRLSISQTLSWLQREMASPSRENEDELRLESDGDAVSVLTVHGAKGLEYEVVFCPFLYATAKGMSSTPVAHCYDPDFGAVCDLGSDRFDEFVRLSLEEENEEDMRLTYVALTRARLRCYVGWAHTAKYSSSPSAFASSTGKTLFPDGECGFSDQQTMLRKYGSRPYCGYRLIPGEVVDPATAYRRQQDSTALQARDYAEERLQTGRIRTSFSGLAAWSKAVPEAPTKAADETDAAVEAPAAESLPRGVRFGNLVHDALELFPFAELGRRAVGEEDLAPLIRRHRLEIALQPLQDLLARTVTTPLPSPVVGSPSFTLADIGATRQIKEMEFTLHLDALNTRAINDILAGEDTVTELSRRQIEGYLNGFIDLIFEHDGRYYIVDYKSNYLGSAGAYRAAGLGEAMRSHNYGLQYWIYTLALHRYLRNWDPSYRYADRFGSIMYLFVRGMNPEQQASGVFCRRPDEATLMKLDACFGVVHHD